MSESRDDRAFREAVEAFAGDVAERFATPVDAQPEAQLTEPVGKLLRACGEPWNLAVDPHEQVKVRGIGWPDLGVTVGGLLCGYVELKAPDVGARPEGFVDANREQWKRYQALPNLIYTNGSEWSLYRRGERAARVRIADDVRGGVRSLDHAKLRALSRLLHGFLQWEPATPDTAHGLAEFLAPIARFLRDEVRDALEGESPALAELRAEWRDILFAEADDAQFADAFTQTLTYALLLARYEGAPNVRRAFAVETLREREYDVLATALDLLENARDELAMPFDLLERAIGAVNAPSLLREEQMAFVPTATRPDDPWLYFYEDFLAAYDPALRKNRGVYFTPTQVVSAQVRFVAELLRDRFVKRDGFADSGVVVLDPATGTGAYPLAVIENAIATVRDAYGEGMVPEKLRSGHAPSRLRDSRRAVRGRPSAHRPAADRRESAGLQPLRLPRRHAGVAERAAAPARLDPLQAADEGARTRLRGEARHPRARLPRQSALRP